GQDAFAQLMDLEHVELGFLARPAEDSPEDVGDVIHIVDGVIPADDQVAGLQLGSRVGGLLLDGPGNGFWCSGFRHVSTLRDAGWVVESGSSRWGPVGRDIARRSNPLP